MSGLSVLLIRNAAPQDFGGGERFPVLLANELKKLGHKPTVFSRHTKLLDLSRSNRIDTYKTWWWRQQSWSGWRVILTPIYLIWQMVLFFYYLIFFMRLRPDVIHIQSKDDFIAGTLAGRVLKKNVIWTDHADLKHIFKNVRVFYKNPTGKLVHLAGRLANSITVVSQSEKRLILENLSKKDPLTKKVTVIHNGSDDKKLNYKKRLDSDFIFCIAGRLVTDKGVTEAIEAFSRFYDTHPKSKLLLVGDGPDRVRFENQAESLPVIFTGHQTDPLEFMAQSDVYLHPTHHEGFSVSLVEASMLGLPIIATDVGGNPEIIFHKKTGLLIPVKDTEALFLAMIRLFEDQSLRKNLGDNARKHFKENLIFGSIVQKQFLPLYNSDNEDSC